VANTITYPADSQTVSNPVTFTGTANPGDVIEIWDTYGGTVQEYIAATDSATVANPPYTVFQGNSFQGNSFTVLAQTASADPNAKSATESETFAVTDSQDHKADIKPTLTAETFGVTDTVGRGAYSKSDESETSTASDSQTNGLGIKPSVSETFAVTDSQGHKIDLKPAQSDTFGVTDSEGHKVDIKAGQSETSGATDSQATGVYIAKDESETNAATDDEAGVIPSTNIILVSQSDTSTAVEQEGHAAYRKVTESDTSGATDSEALGLGLKASQSDTVGATDGHDGQGYVEVPGEVFGIGIASSQSDTVYVSEVTARSSLLGLSATQSDTVGATDSVTKAVGVGSAQSDSFAATDTTGTALPVGAADQIDVCSATDSFAIALRKVADEAETTTGVDAVLSGVALKKALSETSGATDSQDCVVSLDQYATLQDSAIATDAWAFTIEGDEISKFFSDTAIASDAMEAIRGSAALNQTFRVWSGSAWVYWDGGGWV
jgi:hypothetical protein